jgi:biopolymer transport protein ExbD
MRKPAKKHVSADINITPLLDLAWVLLVIFILTAVSIVQSVEVKLPETQESKEEVPTETATVAIDGEGTIFLNEEVVTLVDLEERLKLYSTANPDLPVVLRADKALVYEQVVQVLDKIKGAGVLNLNLATEAAAGGGGASS